MSLKLLSPGDRPEDINAPAIEPARPGRFVDKEYYAPTRGLVTPLVDGKTAFAVMREKMEAAEKYIYLSAWFIQLDTDLGGIKLRQLLATLAKKVRIRILLTVLEPAFFPAATPARDRIVTLKDGKKKLRRGMKSLLIALGRKNIAVQVYTHPFSFRMKGQRLVVGTSHEKMMVIDGKYAFCGGIEPTVEYARAGLDHRHDVHSLIEGPIVHDFERHFVNHWREARREDPAPDRPDAGDLPDPMPSFDPRRDGQAVQIVITKGTDGILFYNTVVETIFRSYLAAIAQANKYVYIENQYFRDPDLTGALIRRMEEVPELRVIVVVPVQAEDEANMSESEPRQFARFADQVQFEQIDRLRKFDERRERVEFFSLSRGAGHDMYVHAKLMIVDDLWYTIGSANANPRSFHLDSESNIIVRDAAGARALRLQLWNEHFGVKGKKDTRFAASFGITQSSRFVAVWQEEASRNNEALRRRAPLRSFVVTHVAPPGDGLKGFNILLDPAVRQVVLNEPQAQESAADEEHFVERDQLA
jgi:phosphatidylserine/phosphatidylglycerophosphate/cardiolipin synthase-like enzyme